MYLVTDTVEEAIYDVSVSRRLAHMGNSSKSQGAKNMDADVEENTLEAANSLEMQEVPLAKLLSKGPGGGEVVEKGDVWKCLFGKGKRVQSKMVAGKSRNGEVHDVVGRHLGAEAAEARMGK